MNNALIRILTVLVILIMTGPAFAAPESRWTFNGDLSDFWGKNAASGNNVEYTDLGISGSLALRFRRGATGRVVVADTPSHRWADFSVMGWVRTLGYEDTSRVVVNKYDHASKTGYLLYARADGRWVFKVDDTTVVGPPVIRGQWIHLAATFETNFYSAFPYSWGTMKLYANGELVAEARNVQRLVGRGAVPLVIGSDWSTASGFFNSFDGYIDDIRVYSNAEASGAIGWLHRVNAITVEVMTYNILYGGMGPKESNACGTSIPERYCDVAATQEDGRRLQIIDCIKENPPDVLLIQEGAGWSYRTSSHVDPVYALDGQTKGNVGKMFQSLLGMPYIYNTRTSQVVVEREDGSTGKEEVPWHKLVILSRYPLANEMQPKLCDVEIEGESVETCRLDDVAENWFDRGILEAEVQVTSGRKFGVSNVHFAWWEAPPLGEWIESPDPAVPTNLYSDPEGKNKSNYRAQRGVLLGDEWLGKLKPAWHPDVRSFPQVIGGDFNHHRIEDWNNALDSYSLHQILKNKFQQDLLTQYHPGSDPIDTFYVHDPTTQATVLNAEKNDAPQSACELASDHRPVSMRFLLRD